MRKRRLGLLKLYVLIILLVWLSAPFNVGAEQIFSRSTSFCPLDLTYEDLAVIIRRLRDVSEKANRTGERQSVRERLSLAGGSTKLELSTDFSEGSLTQGPQLATDVLYLFIQDNAPISEITLRLGDYSRELTVSGTDRTQVEGLILLVSEDFAKRGCSFGGSSKRSSSGLGLIETWS